MSDYNDPPEFTGVDASTRAEPVKSAAPVAPVAEPEPAPELVAEINAAPAAAPVEPVAEPELVAETPRAAPSVAPVAEVECSPFDSLGNIVSPPVKIVAALAPEKRARLMALLAASVETKDAEKAERDLQQAIYAAVADAERKRKEYHRLVPPATFHDELKRTIAARSGRPIPPPTIHPNAEAAAIAADEAEALIGKLRIDHAAQVAIVKSKRTTLAEALLSWQGMQPKRDTAWLVRQNSQRERDRALAIARGEIEPDAQPGYVHQEPIDAALSGGRGSVNARYHRPRAGLRGELAPVTSATSPQLYSVPVKA